MINDFPVVQLNSQTINFIDGEFLKVAPIYKQKERIVAPFYKDLLEKKSEYPEPILGIDPLGFNYVYLTGLCYIGLIIIGEKKLEPTKRIKLTYPDYVFAKKYIFNHIKKDLKFRSYEEFVPIDIVTKNIHELRNLNSKITSNIDDLLGVNNESEWERKFEEANENVKKIYVGARLTKFILDNLRFFNPNYLESLKIDTSRTFTIHKSLLKIVKIFQNDFKKRQSNITFHGNSYKLIRGDKELFEIILMLLIENAIKYSSDINTIAPKVSIKENVNTVEILISSWGEMIPEDEKDKIFASGYRSTLNGSNVTGTGMGLYNAKKIAKLFDALIIYSPEGGFKGYSTLGWNNFYLICRDII